MTPSSNEFQRIFDQIGYPLNAREVASDVLRAAPTLSEGLGRLGVDPVRALMLAAAHHDYLNHQCQEGTSDAA